MVEIVYKKFKPVVELAYGENESVIYMTLDTGSPITVLDVFHISKLMRVSVNKVKQYITFHMNQYHYCDMISYTGHNFKCILCRMDNVILGGELIREFYFYLDTDMKEKRTALLGMDFISLCDGIIKAGNGIQLNQIYNQNARRELNYLQINTIDFQNIE